MMHDLITMALLGSAFLLLFGITEWLYRVRKLPAEVTRKTAHIGTGLLALLFPAYLHEVWHVAVLCGSFLLLLVISKRKHFFSSINNIGRVSYGSILYPVAVFMVYCWYAWYGSRTGLAFQPLYYFYLPVLLLALCDPIAALAGNIYKHHQQKAKGKTMAGSLAFFIAAVIIGLWLQHRFLIKDISLTIILLNIVLTALTSAVAERFSNKGTDNLAIPFCTIISTFIFEQVA